MSFERDQDHAHATSTTADHDDVAPGRSNRAAQLTSPAAPMVSGLIQRKARDANGVAEGAEQAVASASSTSGESLPEPIMRKFESSLGADLSSVRVHTDSSSAHAAESVGAKAYTMGQDIHFAAGQYDPSSTSGQHLLAHEVAHTVQQRGQAPARQNKLAVSGPQDAAEYEADRAADAMIVGISTSLSVGRLGISRKPEPDMGDEMDREANAGGKAAAEDGPLKVADMSSLETVSQARDCMKKVISANGNLYARRATQQAAVNDAKEFSEDKEKIRKDVVKTDGFLEKNEGVITTLQHIVDLGEGNSQTNEQGNRPGHDMRIQVFAQLCQAALVDFGRLQGIVSAFLTAHPMNDKAGQQGGEDLGTAVATGGKGTDPAKVGGQVQDAQRADPILNNKVQEFKTLYQDLSGNNADQNINDQMSKCATAVSKAKNLKVNIDLGTTRPNTPEQATAKQEADKVNADLAEAKGALDQAADIAKLAVAVMGMPEIGALGEGSALAPLTESKVAKNATKVVGAESKINSGAAKVTGVDVNKAVTDGIETAVAKMMTDYDTKINAATGHADQANKNAGREIAKLNKDMLAVAKGEILQEFHELAKICSAVEDKKFKLRAKAKEINDYQKTHKRPGQPDIGAITKALAETTSFIKQADAAILQGEEEQKIAKEMVGERQKVSGDWQKSNAVEDFTGVKELGTATKEDAYFDCEPSPPHLLSQHPLTFRMREDNANKHVEVAGMGVAEQLRGLKESRETAGGFETSLKKAMGF